MTFLRTKMSTDWPERGPAEKDPLLVSLVRLLFWWIRESNPDYKDKMHLVREWLIEFLPGEAGLEPWREIGLDADGKPVLAGPDPRNDGFWCDTNMRFEDFDGEEVSRDLFERLWRESPRSRQSTVIRRKTIDRPISPKEVAVIRTTLERAPCSPAYVTLAADLDRLRAISQCDCGCDSVEFVRHDPEHPSKPLAEAFGDTPASGLIGVIVWGRETGVTGLDIYDCGAGELDLRLPVPESIRAFDDNAPTFWSVLRHRPANPTPPL